jgi:dipeptidyl aminopeptidase/acylaminoacyl peptidase
MLAAVVALVGAPPASARLVATKGFFPGAGRIVVAHDDGSHAHRLARGDEARISPDGRLVAINDSDPGQQGTHPRLKVYRATGGAPLFVLHERIYPLAWSPDSTKLAGVDSANVNDDHLVVVDAGTGARTTLASGDLADATFSPDSAQIAFTRFGTGSQIGGALQVVDLATRTVRTLAEHASGPVWGPHEIAFATLAHNSYRFANVSAIQPDGSGFRRLTHVAPRNAGGFFPVDWSADGRRLLASYFAGTASRAYGIDTVHGGRHLIARRVDPEALSADGRVVIGGTGNPFCCTADPINVVRVAWAGGKPHILLRKAFDASSNR